MILIGDIHSEWQKYKSYLTEKPSIQLGDFGYGFSAVEDTKMLDWQVKNPQHKFIRGNHDNVEVCQTSPNFIKDGTTYNDFFCIGGAWSIDRDFRIPGVDWWSTEELSYKQQEPILEQWKTLKPRRVISHDCPTLVSYYMFIRTNLSFSRDLRLNRTNEFLQQLFEIHQPDDWYFGHWHHTRSAEINGTRFHCLGCHFSLEVD